MIKPIPVFRRRGLKLVPAGFAEGNIRDMLRRQRGIARAAERLAAARAPSEMIGGSARSGSMWPPEGWYRYCSEGNLRKPRNWKDWRGSQYHAR